MVGDWDPLGMRGTVSRTLIFKDVFVPEDEMLMPRGVYFQAAQRWPHMFLTLSPTYPPAAAETLRVRTIGFSWTSADAGSALLLGYGDTTLGFLRNNVCIAPNATQPETPQ